MKQGLGMNCNRIGRHLIHNRAPLQWWKSNRTTTTTTHHVLSESNCVSVSRRLASLSFSSSAIASVEGYDNDYILCTPPKSVVRMHNLLHQGCLSYPKTWAFQQVLLHQRLKERRRKNEQEQQQKEQKQSLLFNNDDEDCDCVVMLEHSPVYTLGRGADETHLTFVRKATNRGAGGDATTAAAATTTSEPSSSSSQRTYEYSEAIVSQKLSRKVRGPGTARLSLDKNMEDQIQDLAAITAIKTKTTIPDATNKNKADDAEQTLMTAVERLTKSISPVVAPNGVPVYRVDRGGEGTLLVCILCVY